MLLIGFGSCSRSERTFGKESMAEDAIQVFNSWQEPIKYDNNVVCPFCLALLPSHAFQWLPTIPVIPNRQQNK